MHRQVFGYQIDEMLTYVFAVLIIHSFVLTGSSADNIGGEIASGDLNNYLLKPMGYLRYWLIRDLASKTLNIGFAVVEVTVLWWWLKPVLVWPSSTIGFLAFLFFCLFALLLYFFLNIISKLIAFWTPENTWALSFLILIFVEILAGGIFPLDILPDWAKIVLQFTPFPYLVYYPISVFLGKITGWELISLMVRSSLWVAVMYWLTMKVWKQGLKSYAAYGR